jgi:hypothetical protein
MVSALYESASINEQTRWRELLTALLRVNEPQVEAEAT